MEAAAEKYILIPDSDGGLKERFISELAGQAEQDTLSTLCCDPALLCEIESGRTDSSENEQTQ